MSSKKSPAQYVVRFGTHFGRIATPAHFKYSVPESNYLNRGFVFFSVVAPVLHYELDGQVNGVTLERFVIPSYGRQNIASR